MKAVDKNYFCELTEEENMDLEGGMVSLKDVVQLAIKMTIMQVTGPMFFK